MTQEAERAKVYVRQDKCPKCGYLFDSGEPPFNPDFPDLPPSRPQEGDFTLCFNCTALLRYGPEMKTELANERRLNFWTRAQIQRVRRAINRTSRKRK